MPCLYFLLTTCSFLFYISAASIMPTIHYHQQSFSNLLPTSLTKLTNLKSLSLYGNTPLTGTIPGDILGELQSLTSLDISNNPNLSGPVPGSLGRLTKLEEIRLYGNDGLSGFVPTSLCSVPAGTEEFYGIYITCTQMSCPASCSCSCW